MSRSLDRWLPDLRCPLTLMRDQREVELVRKDEMLVSALGPSYPVIAEIPDLRPLVLSNLETFDDNYTFIHAHQTVAEPRPDEAGLVAMCASYGIGSCTSNGQTCARG